MLKDRYNLDHFYVGKLNAIRLINEIIMLVYNLYINIRTHEFKKSEKTMGILKKIFEKEIAENKKIYFLFSSIKVVIQ